jgi:hypothetical protein
VSSRFFLGLFLVAAVACGGHPGALASATPAIVLHQQNGAQPAYVEVTGLSASELSSLRNSTRDPADWQSLLKVTVGETAADTLPAVRGRYAASDSGLVFTPLFPFDPGRAYVVTFDPARLPRPRASGVITNVVRPPALTGAPTTTVTAVYPAGEMLPENILRLYIEFSAPMGNRGALDFVRLRDERGQEVPIPFLPVEADFWNSEHTRYTLFFDPGRVKQGILPNEQLGRPLKSGREYTLEVSADWHDAQGRPLAAPYRRTFRVGRAEAKPLSMASWRVAPPGADTLDPLVVSFPAPLDHGLLARALAVETSGGRSIDGDIVLDGSDTRWTFRPRAPWDAGDYRVAALSILEDPAGNRIGRAFEVDMTRPSADSPPEAFRLGFRIARPGF